MKGVVNKVAIKVQSTTKESDNIGSTAVMTIKSLFRYAACVAIGLSTMIGCTKIEEGVIKIIEEQREQAQEITVRVGVPEGDNTKGGDIWMEGSEIGDSKIANGGMFEIPGRGEGVNGDKPNEVSITGDGTNTTGSWLVEWQKGDELGAWSAGSGSFAKFTMGEMTGGKEAAFTGTVTTPFRLLLSWQTGLYDKRSV